jgi:hypothetical protein
MRLHNSISGSFKAVNVKFSNDTNEQVELYWVDFGGGEILYSPLAPVANQERELLAVARADSCR